MILISTKSFWHTVAGLLLFASAGFAGAEDDLRFPGWFTDHMVLQRDKAIPIWGWAKAGESIKVQLGDETRTGKTDATGRWQVSFSPRPAGGPVVLSVEDGATVRTEINDVLIGDVWLIGGQSNMNIPVKHADGAEEAIKNSLDDRLRLVRIHERPCWEPQEDVKGQWETALPKTVSGFPVVGYNFALKLRQEMPDVPIGLIHASVGASCCEAWVGRADLERNNDLAHYVNELDALADQYPEMRTRMEEIGPVWLKNHSARIRSHQDKRAGKIKEVPDIPDTPYPRKLPTLFYNGMIHPITPAAIRGVIWWQGLGNSKPVERAFEYRELFPHLIESWRNGFGQGDFPFIFAEEPTIKKNSAKPGFMVIREAQLMTALSVPRTAVIVNSDLRHDAAPSQPHFPEKPPVGLRMALAALAIEYGTPVIYSGPIYDAKKTKIEGSKMRLGFTHVESSLAVRTGKDQLADFVIAGNDQKFVPAQAKIDGDTVLVWAEAVAHPEAVRYDWDDWTGATLMNKDGFPASPFRTDDWPINDSAGRGAETAGKE